MHYICGMGWHMSEALDSLCSATLLMYIKIYECTTLLHFGPSRPFLKLNPISN